jgi:hypothetical protein
MAAIFAVDLAGPLRYLLEGHECSAYRIQPDRGTSQPVMMSSVTISTGYDVFCNHHLLCEVFRSKTDPRAVFGVLIAPKADVLIESNLLDHPSCKKEPY